MIAIIALALMILSLIFGTGYCIGFCLCRQEAAWRCEQAFKQGRATERMENRREPLP